MAVIFIAEQSLAEIENRVQANGAVSFLEKPYSFDQLISEVQKIILRQSEGGLLRNISPASFIQLMEIERKNCTLRIMDNESQKYGVLFIQDGILVDARCTTARMVNAAYEILSWDNVHLQIENSCPSIENKIRKDLRAVLLEAMRMKDESPPPPKKDPSVPTRNLPSPKAAGPTLSLASIKELITNTIGAKSGLEDIYRDEQWSHLMAMFTKTGDFFNSGAFKVAYVATLQDKGSFLLPYQSTVIAVNHQCHRDHMIDILSNLPKAPTPV